MALVAVNYFCRNIMINYCEFEIVIDTIVPQTPWSYGHVSIVAII